MSEDVFAEFAFVRGVQLSQNTVQSGQKKPINSIKDELSDSYKLENKQNPIVAKNSTFTTENSNLDRVENIKEKTNDPRPPIFRFTLPSNHKGNIIKELSFIPP